MDRRVDHDRQHPTASTLLAAYAQGVFPMADPRQRRIHWYCPDPRGVLPMDRLRVPANVAKLVRQRRFELRIDTATPQVIDACAGARSPTNPGWMSRRLLAAYLELHAAGFVHSVEAWRDGRLVGGLYGVTLGSAFFGESMFVRPDLGGANSSKVCLVHLVDRLRAGAFTLLDTQVVTDHMRQFGTREIPAAEYLASLATALGSEGRWSST